ncbi:MAG: hypothetical protein H6708_16015 [Kofleriaceae bacterium]|nr:hypothetical protein [Myxococcales bacterium]MCB9561910.1 hypothetical protein [Kofleriaceae bacterium]
MPTPRVADGLVDGDRVADNGLACPDGTQPVRRTIALPDADDQVQLEETGCVLDDGRFHGPYRRADLGGATVEAGAYDHGLRTGPWQILMTPDGGGRAGDYVEGVEDGEWKSYWREGKVAWVGRFDHGRRVGHWTWYFEAGGPQQEGDFVDGLQDGAWRYYPGDPGGERTEHWRAGVRVDPDPPATP